MIKLISLVKYIFPHLVIVILFLGISVFYCTPVLKGKLFQQPDTKHFRGTAKELLDYVKTHEEPSYWTNRVFSGMPSYFIFAPYKYDLLNKLDIAIKFFPRPVGMLFMALLGFYLLLLSLNIDYRVSLFGALSFGFTTYLFIVIAAGHNTKAITIGYLPLAIAGILMIFNKNRLFGFMVATFGIGMSLAINHPQMTYYMFLLMLVYGIVELVYHLKQKSIVKFIISGIVCLLAVILAIGMTSTKILVAKEYVTYSIRGKSELVSVKENNNQTSGLDRDYITQWSYGISETLNLLIPNLKGGSSSEPLSSKRNLRKSLIKLNVPPNQSNYILQVVPTYWGDQPFTSGPAYQGAIVFLVFFIGIFLIKGKFKIWLISGVVLSILLAWGKNFPFLTNLFIDYFPFYNKFRAVSSILVIAEISVPLLASIGLWKWVTSNELEEKRKALLYAGSILLLILFAVLIFHKQFFSFTSPIDEQLPDSISKAIQKDRILLLKHDTLRTLGFVFIGILLLILSLKNKISSTLLIFGLAILSLLDLWNINKRYLNDSNFESSKKVLNPYSPDIIDNEILKDSLIVRVLDLSTSAMQDSRTSYFHNSLGGYSAVKLRKYQELYSTYIENENANVLNMLNTKYIIKRGESGRKLVINSNHNGNAWFVESIKFASNANEELQFVGLINSKLSAVTRDVFKHQIQIPMKKDSTAYVELKTYSPNRIVYESVSKEDGFVVFSEIYYPKGWKASIDGKFTNHYPVNYLLRGMNVPKGKHQIEFIFDPEVVKIGSKVTLFSYIVFGIIMICLLLFYLKNQKYVL